MSASPQFRYLCTEVRDGVAVITYARPEVANAINVDVMKELVAAYTWAIANDKVKVIVQTGLGDFFTTGMDLSSSRQNSVTSDAPEILHSFNKMLIDCEKVTIAAVNGPGAGYGTSSLALFDLVYAVPNAYFFTPFVKWGLSAEACSSFTFTHCLGRQKAAHLILAGERMTAQELESAGMISKILPKNKFLDAVLSIAQRVAQLPPISLKANKSLMTGYFKQELHQANDLEKELFETLITGSETTNAVTRFKEEQRARKQALAGKASPSKL